MERQSVFEHKWDRAKREKIGGKNWADLKYCACDCSKEQVRIICIDKNIKNIVNNIWETENACGILSPVILLRNCKERRETFKKYERFVYNVSSLEDSEETNGGPGNEQQSTVQTISSTIFWMPKRVHSSTVARYENIYKCLIKFMSAKQSCSS